MTHYVGIASVVAVLLLVFFTGKLPDERMVEKTQVTRFHYVNGIIADVREEMRIVYKDANDLRFIIAGYDRHHYYLDVGVDGRLSYSVEE
jgi:hypothetical protein